MKPLAALILSAAGLALFACDQRPAPAPMPAAAPPTPPAAPPATPFNSTQAPAATPSPAAAAGEVSAGGFTFHVPEGWKSVPPANSMRLAELHVPDASGDASRTCIAVFSSAGGGVEANIARWSGQVRDASGQPVPPTTSTREVAGMKVHIAEMTGAFSPGMGDTQIYQNWTIRGAIIESPRGLLFIKMTGPAEAMTAAKAAFDAMVAGLRT